VRSLLPRMICLCGACRQGSPKPMAEPDASAYVWCVNGWWLASWMERSLLRAANA